MRRVSILPALLLTGCQTTAPSADLTPSAIDAPASVMKLVADARDDFTPIEAEKKERDGRVYYDVEGILDDGSELEFDVLMTESGPEIVEIQRDLEWVDVPEDVRALALAASGGAVPVRTIEGIQTDEAIIYEFFADGAPSEPAVEVRVKDGEASVLEERWLH